MQSKPLMLALCGGSGSGKTTLANDLAQALPDGYLTILTQDHYYRDLSHLNPEERHHRNFDEPDALDHQLLTSHIHSLARGITVERPCYDFSVHTRQTRTIPVRPGNAIILDGIFSLCFPGLLKYFDLKIFVDVPDDIRFIRRMLRDQSTRGRDIQSITEQYLGSVRQGYENFVVKSRKYADLIVPWEQQNPLIIRMLKGYILSRAPERSAARS